MARSWLPLCLVILLGACGDDGPASSPAGVVSRTQGVAPLSVHFWAGFLGVGDAADRFRDYDYTWDFGDPGSGTWGTTGNSRNRAKGGAAVHVFESPGTYTVTLTVRGAGGVVATESYEVTVDDPEVVYAASTTCVSDATSADFTGCPAGAQHLASDDLSTVTQAVSAPGSRLLFRRGSAWTTGELTWPSNAGPVTIGAYGSGVGADALGLYDNAPLITVTSGSFLNLDYKQDWRIMDLHLVDPTRTAGSFGGAQELQRQLFLRLRLEGFATTFGWSHWNTARPVTLDEMSVVSCELSGGQGNVAYIGGERLALLGSVARDAQDSHVVRVWQAYRSVISDNLISGSSLATTDGRHALKLHGPGYSTLEGVNEHGTPTQGTGLLANYTEFCVVSDNVFGSSGPWPVAIGPQDGLTDTTLTAIVFERNRVASGYGAASATPVQVALHIEAQTSVLRNNVFDGTGSSNDYTAIAVGFEVGRPSPPPHDVEILNNTIYHGVNDYGNVRAGIAVVADATATTIRNNLVVFPAATVPLVLIDDDAGDTVASNNLLGGAVSFDDPDAADPLARLFSLTAASSDAIDQGYADAVLEDFAGHPRPAGGGTDIGAYER